MEQYSDDVCIGKLIEEKTYNRRSKKHKQIIFGNLKIDYLDSKNKILYETKKSSKFLDSAIWQMKYYIYNMKGYVGVIEIPKERKKVDVILTDDDIIHIEFILKDIERIFNGKAPMVLNSDKCSNCSFYEFCYS